VEVVGDEITMVVVEVKWAIIGKLLVVIIIQVIM
jgi:hypothetical protein